MVKNTLKIVSVLLAIVFVLSLMSGCQTKAFEDVPKPVSVAEAAAEAERQAAEAAEKAAKEAEEEASRIAVVEGIATVKNVDILYGKLNRGAKLNVMLIPDLESPFYMVELEDGEIARIDKELVRLDGEKQIEEYTAGVSENADVYDSAYMVGTLGSIEAETEVTVIDEFAGVRVIKYGEDVGYISSDVPLVTGVEESGQDETEETGEAQQSGTVKGTVLTDYAEIYNGVLSTDEAVEVTDLTETTASIIDRESNTGIVPRWAVSVEGDEAYSSWNAFTTDGFSAYPNYMEIGSAVTFEKGTPINIICRTDDQFVVETDEGDVFYAGSENFYNVISSTVPEEEPEEEIKEEESEEDKSEDDEKEDTKEKSEKSSDSKKKSDSSSESKKESGSESKKETDSDSKKDSGSDKDSGSSDSGKKEEEKQEESSSSDEDNYPDAVKGKVKYTAQCKVTAYCSYCDPSGVGSSGAKLSYGSLAADKSIFPYGTRIYIPGYGIGTVVDTGVSGYTIDVYMGDQPDETVCNNWGRKNLTVYVLK